MRSSFDVQSLTYRVHVWYFLNIWSAMLDKAEERYLEICHIPYSIAHISLRHLKSVGMTTGNENLAFCRS